MAWGRDVVVDQPAIKPRVVVVEILIRPQSSTGTDLPPQYLPGLSKDF